MHHSAYDLSTTLSASGRNSGHLSIAISQEKVWRTRVHVISGGEGPTILLTGALHGDEYEGPIALTKLARGLDPSKMRGRVIIVPIVNVSAMSAQRRCSPMDDLDLNRCFPGEIDGSPSRRLAYAISEALLPEADLVIDCHSGGSAMMYVPCAMMHPLTDLQRHQQTLHLIAAMLLPAGVVIDETDKPGMFDTYVEKLGKPFVCCEFGGGGVSPETVAIADHALQNALIHLGVIDGELTVPTWGAQRKARLLEVPSTDYAEAARTTGLFEPVRELGDRLKAGELVALIHPEDSNDSNAVPMVSPYDGLLFIRRATGWIEKGQRAFMVARPLLK